MPRTPDQTLAAGGIVVPDGTPPAKKEEVLAPNPSVPENYASNFAMAVESATQGQLSADRVKEVYSVAGRVHEWDGYKQMWMKAKDREFATQLAGDIVNKARDMGLTPDELYRLDQPTVDAYITDTTQAFFDLVETPELAALMSNEVTNPDITNKFDEEVDWYQQNAANLAPLIKREQDINNELLEDLMTDMKEIYGEDWEPDTFKEWAVGIGMEIPGILNYIWFWNGLADAMNVEITGTDKVLAGNIQNAMREAFLSAPENEKRQMVEDFKTYMINNPVKTLTSFRAYMAVESVFGGNVTQSLDPEAQFETVVENIFPVVDLLGLGAAAKFLYRPIRGSSAPAIKATNSLNKDKVQQQLGAIFDEVNQSETLNKWGVSKQQIAQSQMPKPDFLADIEDVPGGVLGEAERVRDVQQQAFDIANEAQANVLAPTDKARALERTAKAVEEAAGARIRMGQSRLVLDADEGGATFHVMLGQNDTLGFLNDRAAFELIESMSENGSNARVWISDGQKLTPFVEGDEAISRLKQMQDGTLAQNGGNFYVELDQKVRFTPMDKGLFGDNPVLGPTFLGGGWRPYLLTPSARFSKEVYRPYLRNFYNEQALSGTLERMVAPIFKMPPATRRTIDEMYDWTAKFGRENDRLATMDEIMDAFPSAGTDAYKGIYLVRQFYDTIYQIQNKRLFSDWSAQGFRTVRAAGSRTEYHGAPQTRAQLSSAFDGNKTFHAYDPETNAGRTFTSSELESYLGEGNGVLKSGLPIETEGNNIYEYFLDNKNSQVWSSTELSQTPLTYIPGYYPRIYEDFHFIEKVVPNASVNGRVKEHVQVTHAAGTIQEAERMVRRLSQKEPGATWRVKTNDPRFSQKDKISADLERMQIEGRLFFDERNQQRLRAVDGGFADIVTPIDTLQRTSRMVSRQISTEDLVKSYKVAFQQQYGDIVPDITRRTTREISADLDGLVATQTGAAKKTAVAARDLWDYIRVMEGSVNQGGQFFRRSAVAMSEYISELTSGIPAARRPSQWLVRNAHRASPLEATKSYVFFDFLVTRPFRQLILQSMQHTFVQALDPTYVGRWQADTTFLLSGMKNEAMRQMGSKKTVDSIMKRNSKLMGMSEQEYRELLRRFDNSGLVQTINVHSFAGDLPSSRAATPKTMAGDLSQRAFRTATLEPIRNSMKRFGFELGEQFNVGASWLMALRLYKKNNNITDIRKISDDGWREIQARGADFALAMSRPNAANFQYGIASLPLQFLQFTHKTFLVGLRALAPSLGNKQFSTKEARKILMAQILLYGGAGVGVKELTQELLQDSGIGQAVGTEAEDIIAGGILDYMMDKSLNFSLEKFTGEESDLNLAWDEFLAPGANILNTFQDAVEMGFETPLVETFLGPSENTFSRVSEAYQLARVVVKQEQWSPEERWARALDQIASGAFAGYSDWMKARMAAKWGQWISGNGQATELEAQWGEIVAKGLLGLNSERALDSYRIYENERDLKKELDGAADEYSKRIRRLITSYAGDEVSKDRYAMEAQGMKSLLETALEETEYQYVMERVNTNLRRSNKSQQDMATVLARKVNGGLPISDHTKQLIRTSDLFDEEQKAVLISIIETQIEEADRAGEQLLKGLETDVEALTDGS